MADNEETEGQKQLRKQLKRKRADFEDEESPKVNIFFYNLYETVESICVVNNILKDYLKEELSKQATPAQTPPKRGSRISKAKLIDDGHKIVFAQNNE